MNASLLLLDFNNTFMNFIKQYLLDPKYYILDSIPILTENISSHIRHSSTIQFSAETPTHKAHTTPTRKKASSNTSATAVYKRDAGLICLRCFSARTLPRNLEIVFYFQRGSKRSPQLRPQSFWTTFPTRSSHS